MDKKKLLVTSAIAAAFAVGTPTVAKAEDKGKCVLQAAGKSACGMDSVMDGIKKQDAALHKYIDSTPGVKHSCSEKVDAKGVHWKMITAKACQEAFDKIKSEHQKKMVWIKK